MAFIPNQRLANLRALIVEDMVAMRQNIRSQLGQLGINHVDQVATPNEAIRAIRKTGYDVILCDYNLNCETDGQQLLEFLRSQGMLTPTTMFIMITAETSYDFVAAAAEFQPDGYMVKPLTGTKIGERIERLLDKQHAFRGVNGRLKLKDIAGAVDECDLLVKHDPKWAIEALKIKAKGLMDISKLDDARAVYAQALAVRDDLVWAKLGLAKCDQLAGRLDQARESVMSVLQQNSKYVVAYDLLAQVAEEQGNDAEALHALNQSYGIIPSARRSRLVGEVAYRTGDLDQAREAFGNALKHTKGSLTAQPSDALSLAQVHVDSGEPELALKVLDSVPKEYAETKGFSATQAAVEAQAHVKLGDFAAAEKAFETAKGLTQNASADTATLALAKAAFSMGRDDDGAQMLSKAVQGDHENKKLVSLVRKVLTDSGKEALAATVVDGAVNQVMSTLAEANSLMRNARYDESMATLETALKDMPDNTGVLLAAAQLHLLWMSQKGLKLEYVERVNRYLAKLDTLMPGNERVAKMYRFLRETLSNTAKRA